MPTQVYLQKRLLRSKKRNGQRNHTYSLRWQDPSTGDWRTEACKTADRTAAESLQKLKWAEVNGFAENVGECPQLEPEPAAKRPSWDDCRAELQRAMQADNLRPSTIGDYLLVLDGIRRMFPDVDGPQGITPELANEYKRRRSEAGASPWSVQGDLTTAKAVFGKWLGRECDLLDPAANPFAGVKSPRCDEPDVRIVTQAEQTALFAWLSDRWNNWRLPLVYLQVADVLGWRATEIAGIRQEDVSDDGYVRVLAESCKTRRQKYGWLPPALLSELQTCAAGGWAFGRFSDELRRLLLLWKRRPHHAAKVKDFTPDRLVGWLQDELARFNDERAESCATWGRFTLHDFRRGAITGLQMAGVSEKDTSVMVGATPEVIRRHYEKLDQQAIARRSVERRLAAEHRQQLLRTPCARPLDTEDRFTQVVGA